MKARAKQSLMALPSFKEGCFMHGDAASGTSPTPTRRQGANFGLSVSLYVGSIVLLAMACALPMYAPDALARIYLQQIAWCLGTFGIVCFLFFSLIGLPHKPAKRWILPAWRALAAAEIGVTTSALVLFVIQPSYAGQLSERLLQVAIVGVWICFASGLVLGIQGRTNGVLSRANAQSGSATPDSVRAPHDERES